MTNYNIGDRVSVFAKSHSRGIFDLIGNTGTITDIYDEGYPVLVVTVDADEYVPSHLVEIFPQQAQPLTE